MDKKQKDNKRKQIKEPVITVRSIVDSFISEIIDIQNCENKFIPIATEAKDETVKHATDFFANVTNINIEQYDNIKLNDLLKQFNKVHTDLKSDHINILQRSLFIYLFTTYDKFISTLIKHLFESKPTLFNQFKDKTIQYETISEFNSLEEIKNYFLDKEIECFLRESYKKQFEQLGCLFNLKKVNNFEEWPDFIESAQRRNLYTHCNGIVNKQYLQECKQAGYQLDSVAIGDKLTMDSKYFNDISDKLKYISIIVSQTLFRKIHPDKSEIADNDLLSYMYDHLVEKSWNNAIRLGKYALTPLIKPKEITARMICINHASALRFKGDKKESLKILAQYDWSASSYDFQLAYAVLTDNYTKAKSLMIKIGHNSDLIDECYYHDWPLFNDFRDTDEFNQGYQKVYGYSFYDKNLKSANFTKHEIKECLDGQG